MTAHLCLGTASWATDQPYNGKTPPDDVELRRILDVAEARGIRWLDTAIAYGNAANRLDEARAWHRFKVITKVNPGAVAAIDVETALLSHLGPDDLYAHPHGRFSGASPFATLVGASVYTVAQATAALDAGVQVLQVPWNIRTHLLAEEERKDERNPWFAVRDRAYADGVLFFGRQPFVRGQYVGREEFGWALQTNPRGWCVVGVETADQVSELCDWRDVLCNTSS